MTTDDHKAAGNKAFAAKEYAEAIHHFTLAIDAEAAASRSNHVLYSNRSAAHAAARDYVRAREDALRTTEIAPDWAKGYSRLAAACIGLGDEDAARDALKRGLELEPDNAALKDMMRGLDKKSGQEQNPSNPFLDILKDPQIFAKLANNPSTSALLADVSFCRTLRTAIDNPQLATSLMTSDTRLMSAMLALMGLNIGGNMEMPSASSSSPNANNDSDSDNDEDKKEKNTINVKNKHNINGDSGIGGVKESEEPPKSKQPSPADVKREAGNAAYRARQFEEARKHYDEALEILEGNDAKILNNIAALEYERGDYVAAETFARRALEVGRATGAGFEFGARALLRAGKAIEARYKQELLQEKQQQEKEEQEKEKENESNAETVPSPAPSTAMDTALKACAAYRASLAEHRTAEALTRLNDLERRVEMARKAAYHSPALSAAARERGNAFFAAGEFTKAVPEYTEAIKRDEKDARGYANRSAAYCKLLSVAEALRDAEKAIALDPSYVKGYVRKANAQLLRRDYAAALETCEKAESINLEALRAEGSSSEAAASASASPARRQADELAGLMARCYAAIEEQNRALHGDKSDPKKREEMLRTAMQNPEIAAIMSDPSMRIVLEQMSSDPRAAQEYMSDPTIAAKIRKLVAAGIVSTR